MAVPFIYNRRWGSLSCQSGHRIRRNITVINQRQTGAEVTTVWQFSPAARASLRPHFAGNSACFPRKERRILWPRRGKKEINEKEKQLHWKRNRHCVRLHDERRTNKTRRWNCVRLRREKDWCLLDEKRDLQIAAFTGWFCLTHQVRGKCRNYNRNDFQWRRKNGSFIN